METQEIEKSKALFKITVSRLAIDAICNKQDVSQEVKKIYGHGASVTECYFGKEFAKSCAKQASNMIAQEKFSFNDGVFHLYRNTKNLNDTEFHLGLAMFKNYLQEKMPELFLDNYKNKLEKLSEQQQKELATGGLIIVHELKPQFEKDF